MKEEAEQVFYSENNLRIDTCLRSARPLWVRKNSDMIKYVRRIHLCIDCMTKDNLALHKYSIKAIVQALKKRQVLAFLKITIVGRIYGLPTKDLDSDFDRVLEIWTDLCGLETWSIERELMRQITYVVGSEK